MGMCSAVCVCVCVREWERERGVCSSFRNFLFAYIKYMQACIYYIHIYIHIHIYIYSYIFNPFFSAKYQRTISSLTSSISNTSSVTNFSYTVQNTDPSQWPCVLKRKLQLLDCWDCSFESRWWQPFYCLAIAVCCVVSVLWEGEIGGSVEYYSVCVCVV
jgi:hypothetical protein